MKLSQVSGRLWHCCRGWERDGWVGESAAQDTTNALIAARLLALILRYCVVLSFQPLILVLQTGDGESVWDWVQQWACQLPEHLERRRHQDDQGEIEPTNLGLWGRLSMIWAGTNLLLLHACPGTWKQMGGFWELGGRLGSSGFKGSSGLLKTTQFPIFNRESIIKATPVNFTVGRPALLYSFPFGWTRCLWVFLLDFDRLDARWFSH